MRRVVVDASALVEYLLRTPRARAIGRVIQDPATDLHAPALCDVEVVAVLRRLLLGRRLGIERAADAVEDLLDLPVMRHGHGFLLDRMLGLRRNFSAYDASYLALAEWLHAALLTADDRLASAAPAHADVSILPVRS